MRIFLIAVSASLAFTAPAGAETRNFGINGFTKVRVEGPFKVSLATGVAPYARASGSPQALDRLTIVTSGDTLVVQSGTSSWGGYPGAAVGPVEVSIGTHELNSALLSGDGSLSIERASGLAFALVVQGSGNAEIGDVEADQLSVNLVGSGSAKLAGRAKKLTAVVRGISSLDAAALAVTDATIGAQGAATIDANVGNTATIGASGPATIRLQGQPSCTLHVSDSTSVSGCR